MPADRDIPREDLPHDLSLLLDAMRREFDAKVLGLKYWGIAMTLGSGTLGGIISGLRPHESAAALHTVLGLFA
jgi:hypothetical protein